MRPLIIAHRGACKQEPENTLRAFDAAIRQGADIIELDLRITIDNYMVACHDSFGSKTLNEIKQLDVGKGETIPTLDEIFDLVIGKSKLYLEIKDPEAANETIRIIRQRKIQSEVMIASFNLELMRHLGNSVHDIELGVIIDDPDNLWMRLNSINYQVLSLFLELCTPENVIKAKAACKKLFVWTVDKPEDADRMIQLKVDGIVTNVPDLFR